MQEKTRELLSIWHAPKRLLSEGSGRPVMGGTNRGGKRCEVVCFVYLEKSKLERM